MKESEQDLDECDELVKNQTVTPETASWCKIIEGQSQVAPKSDNWCHVIEGRCGKNWD